MEDFFSIILLLALMLALAYGMLWLIAKFLGMTFYHPLNAKQAQYDNLREQDYLNSIAIEEPDIYKEAIANCKKKHYRVTVSNVLNEIEKIKKRQSGKPTSTQMIGSTLVSLKNSLNRDHTAKKLEKLENLHKLKENKTITEAEFNRLKRDIIG